MGSMRLNACSNIGGGPCRSATSIAEGARARRLSALRDARLFPKAGPDGTMDYRSLFKLFWGGGSSVMAHLSGVESEKALAAGARVHANLPVSQLIETALIKGEAKLAANGALVAETGARTGRSPKDKFIVDDAATHELE